MAEPKPTATIGSSIVPGGSRTKSRRDAVAFKGHVCYGSEGMSLCQQLGRGAELLTHSLDQQIDCRHLIMSYIASLTKCFLPGEKNPRRPRLIVTVLALVVAFASFASVDDATAARLDPRDIKPTEIKLSDWLALRGDDRRVMMVGFAVGWQGREPAVEPELMADVKGEFDALDLQITKLANSSNSARARIATALARAQLLDRLPFVEVVGVHWLELPVRHRLLMLHGVVAGIYAFAVWEDIGRVRDARSIDDGLAQALRLRRPPMAADPLLLLSWLTDHLSNEENAEDSLVTALAAVTRQLDG